VLGPIRLHLNGQVDSLGGTKQRTVVAALLLAPGQMLSDNHLSQMLWGIRPPATALAQIHTYASRLRQRLGCHADVVRLQAGYQLITNQIWCDTLEYTQLTERGFEQLEAGRYEEATRLLQAALGLWRGEAVADGTAHLIEAERPWLAEGRLLALEGRIEAELALGRHRQLVSELTSLVASYPFRERFRALLMTALCRSDHQAAAIEVFHAGRRMLSDELGVDPGPLLIRTYDAILSGELTRLGAILV
jgi:DNA-binding SARP family transcriptional activator